MIRKFLPSQAFLRKLLISLLLISFTIFILCVIPYPILISFLFFVTVLWFYLKFELQEIKKTGLFPYLPENMREILLTRSLFDILCDIWYIPSFSLYLKVFIRPFIYQIKPEEAIENLSDLSTQQREKALRKGLINIFPQTVQEIIMPNRQIPSESLKVKAIEAEKKEEQTKNFNNDSMISLESTIDGTEDEEKVYLLKREINRPYDELINNNTAQNTRNFQQQKEEPDCIASKMNKISFFNFDKDDIDNRNFVFDLFEPSEAEKIERKPIKFEKTPSQINNYVVADKKSIKKEQDRLKGLTLTSFTTKVLASSKKIAQMNLMEQMKKACERSKQKWDRLEHFLGLSQKTVWAEHNLKPAFRIPYILIKKIQDLKFSKVSIQQRPLLKLFIGSNLLLSLLFLVSRRSRKWLIHSFLALLYFSGFVVSVGSLACFGIKHIMQKRRKEIVEIKKE